MESSSLIVRAPSSDGGDGLLVISARKLVIILSLIAVGLAVASTVARLYVHQLGDGAGWFATDIARRFDLDHEVNIPTWFSSTMLFVCSLLLAAIAAAHRRGGNRFTGHWALLAVGFLYLSLDEAIALHETLILPLRGVLHTRGLLYYAWVVPALVLLCLLGLAYVPFLIHLDSRSRRLFLLSGAIYLSGALGTELVGGALDEASGKDTMGYLVVMTLEETLEMLGVAVFIGALLDHGQRHFRALRLIVADRAGHRSGSAGGLRRAAAGGR